MIYIKELAQGNRIAHIFRLDQGYCVKLFQKLTDVGKINFADQISAETYAQLWIQDK